jgi:abequosyltransferase
MSSISFCIPTRNFGAFIGETLDSLVMQCGPEDEIVIVDGNSTDNTSQIVAAFAEKFPRITYERNNVNRGVDRDLARAVELAKGDYCWLFSADDGLVPGAVDGIRDLLAIEPTAVLTERVDCDLRLRPIRRRRWLTARSDVSGFQLADDASLVEYLERVRSLGAIFSYVSCIVVHRIRWLETAAREPLWGSNYAHVGRLLDLLRQPASTLLYVRRPLVLCRGDNDSFINNDMVNRFFIDFNGYGLIAHEVFADRVDLASHLLAAVRRDHGLVPLAGLRSRVSSESWPAVRGRLESLGYPSWLLLAAEIIGVCRPIVQAGRYFRAKADRSLVRLRGRLQRPGRVAASRRD